ncbi:MAG: hypothetical protein AAFY15_00010 [Cyanobacteria bacterium J06648_11]
MKLVNDDFGRSDDVLDTATVVPQQVLQNALLHRLSLDTELLERRVEKERRREEQEAWEARFRRTFTLFIAAVFSLLLAAIAL